MTIDQAALDRLADVFSEQIMDFFPELAGDERLPEFGAFMANQTSVMAAAFANLPRIDTTARDYVALRQQMVQALRVRFPEITDDLESNNGVVLVELFAGAVAMLHYYLDNRAENCFLSRATEYRSALAHARFLGYTPATNVSAAVLLTFSRSNGYATNTVVTIPAGTRVTTAQQAVFETGETVVLASGAASIDVLAYQRETRSERFIGTGTSMQVTLAGRGYLAGSAVVSVDGNTYTEVAGFWDSNPSDRHFRVDILSDGRARVVFGDGSQGAAPPKGSEVSVRYWIGGGASGNVLARQINRSVDRLTDAGGVPARLEVVNQAAAYGGRDREPIASIQVKAPRFARTSNSCVSDEDYIHHAEEVPGVRRAGFLSVNERPTIPENTVIVAILPENGVSFETLKNQVEAWLSVEHPRVVTQDVIVAEAVLETVAVTMDLWTLANHDRAKVERDIRAALAEYFDPDERHVDFGRPVYLSVLYDLVQSIPGVRNIRLRAPSEDVTPDVGALPSLGTVTIQEGT